MSLSRTFLKKFLSFDISVKILYNYEKHKKGDVSMDKNNIINVDYVEEMQKSYVDYAVSVITERALPDVRDGLKPVHRRILWAMKILGLKNSGPYKKSARIVGETMGKFHPHGDSSIYDAMSHMTQEWCYNHPLVDGHGNFGSVEGDEQAASRYTEARLSKISENLFLQDLEKGLVEFVPNFDDNETEPTVLPVKIPNLLLTGTEGIAVGMASKIPTHNLGEIIDACIAYIDNQKLKTKDLMKFLKGPDFATGGIIANSKELVNIYEAGTGKIRVRGKVTTETSKNGKVNIVITEIPYTMVGAIDKFMENLANLCHSKVFPDISDIKNLSGKDGIRIVIELKTGSNVQKNINMLYKKAKLEDTFGYNALAICNGTPKQLSLTEIINEFIIFNNENYKRKYEFLLNKETTQKEIKEGLIRAIDCVDLIIEVLRGAKSVQDAKQCLMFGKTENITFKTKTNEKKAKILNFTELQTNAILEMKMQRLIGLELTILEKELNEHIKKISEYSGLLSSKVKMKNKIKNDLLQIKNEYSLPRKTKLQNEAEIEIEKEEIKEENICVVIDRFGYIKSFDEVTYERNKDNINQDFNYIIMCKNTDKICIFTNTGKCHFVKCNLIPFAKYKDKGVMINNISNLMSNENILLVCSFENIKNKEMVFVNKQGMGKIVQGIEFEASKKTVDSTKPNSGDLVFIQTLNSETDIAINTENKFFIRFKIDEISKMKKTSVGVRCIKLSDGDNVKNVKIGTTKDNIDGIEFKNIKLTKRDCAGTRKK